jgi:hypothetical protein
MTDVGFSHPELARRWGLLVGECWKRSWNPYITSSSRSYETQTSWYKLWIAGQWPTGPVANPDQFWGWAPWGMPMYGSLHMVQKDGYSHALDVVCGGANTVEFQAVAWQCGLRFPERGEYWHCQWWGNDGIYPVYLEVEEPDMTLDEYMHGIGRVAEPGTEGGLGELRIIDGAIHQKLDDGQWYTLADRDEFIHRHMKSLDEGK